MAAVSAWGKPGAWALDAEEHDAAAAIKDDTVPPPPHQPSEELFPSLAAAAASTKTKKKKPQTVSLAEFTTGRQPVAPYRPASSRNLPSNDATYDLPTGPRERTAEELERGGGRGFGYSPSSFGRSGDSSSSSRDEPRRGSGGFDRESDGPSRADEADDWGAGKQRSLAPPPMERRTGGFFGDSLSRADDSNSWVSNKTAPPPSRFDGPRERRGGGGGFENREGQIGGGGGGGADSDTWGRRREDPITGSSSAGGRPRLALQPRTQPLANNNNNNNTAVVPGDQPPAVAAPTVRAKGSNPFGEARPREEVLKEKGKDWKEIDEKLESTKIREVLPEGGQQQQLGRKGFLNDPEDRTERAWRKPDTAEAPRVEEPNELPGN